MGKDAQYVKIKFTRKNHLVKRWASKSVGRAMSGLRVPCASLDKVQAQLYNALYNQLYCTARSSKCSILYRGVMKRCSQCCGTGYVALVNTCRTRVLVIASGPCPTIVPPVVPDTQQKDPAPEAPEQSGPGQGADPEKAQAK